MSSSISRGSLSYGTPVFVGKENKRGTVITADYELIFVRLDAGGADYFERERVRRQKPVVTREMKRGKRCLD